MTIADYDAVYDLWIHTPGMGLNTTDDSREGIDKYLRRNPTTSFVALDGDAVVGVIMAGHDGRRGFIHHTAVLPTYRGQGIATRLVRPGIGGHPQDGAGGLFPQRHRKLFLGSHRVSPAGRSGVPEYS